MKTLKSASGFELILDIKKKRKKKKTILVGTEIKRIGSVNNECTEY